MIVYGDKSTVVDTKAVLQRLQTHIKTLAHTPAHEAIIDFIVEYGDLETALVDFVCCEEDRSTGLTRLLRKISVLLGRLLYRSWREDLSDSKAYTRDLIEDIHQIHRYALPPRIRLHVPEGYAY
jgi:hypothetical protein